MTDWKIFPSQAACQQYADQQWAAFLSNMPQVQIPAADRAKIPPQTSNPAGITPGQAAACKTVKLLGRNAEGTILQSDGASTAWATPRQTADGKWAVPCLPGEVGDPEPIWPTVVTP
jgi:hypothetical protein